MAGRTLDAYEKQFPKVLWNHIFERLNVPSLDIGTVQKGENVDRQQVAVFLRIVLRDIVHTRVNA
jgi:hypothetical protein